MRSFLRLALPALLLGVSLAKVTLQVTWGNYLLSAPIEMTLAK
ncbi:MAG TPA: hypothetical protein VM182_10515 [Terriglobia bacterium]|nr:hypothetical protein [Terriglobia bacterium]